MKVSKNEFWKKMEEQVSIYIPEISDVFQHKAYKNHFEGYVEVRVKNRRGKEKVRRVYKGEYYMQKVSTLQYVLLRLLYLLGIAAGSFLFLKGSIFELNSNYAAGVVFVQSVTGLLIVWSVVTFLIYLMTPRKMTVGDYNTVSASFRKALRNIVVGIAAVIIMTLGYDIVFEGQLGTGDLVCLVYFALSCLIFFGMKRLEEHIEYQPVS